MRTCLSRGMGDETRAQHLIGQSILVNNSGCVGVRRYRRMASILCAWAHLRCLGLGKRYCRCNSGRCSVLRLLDQAPLKRKASTVGPQSWMGAACLRPLLRPLFMRAWTSHTPTSLRNCRQPGPQLTRYSGVGIQESLSLSGTIDFVVVRGDNYFRFVGLQNDIRFQAGENKCFQWLISAD